jgi:hypothetical protein
VAVVKIARMIMICTAAAIIAAGAPWPARSPAATPSRIALLVLREPSKASWIPNTIWDDVIDLGGDVVRFLMRMIPGVG